MNLLWLPMRRLALKLPTPFQVNSSYTILFHDGDVSLPTTRKVLELLWEEQIHRRVGLTRASTICVRSSYFHCCWVDP